MWGEVDAPSSSCPYYGSWQKDGCVRPRTRQWSSRLWDIAGTTWEDACARKAVSFSADGVAVNKAQADRCQKDVTSTQMWGQVDVSDSSCPLPYYDPWVRGECTNIGIRTWFSRLQNIVGPWQEACVNYAPVSFTADGTSISKPRADRCIDKNVLGMWGEVDVTDSSCPAWGSWKRDGCKNFEIRQWSSKLLDIPVGFSWESACAAKALSFTGDNGLVSKAKPDRCVNIGGIEMWGEVDAPSSSCPYYGSWQKDGCVRPLVRQWSSRLWDIAGTTWEDACARKAVSFSADGVAINKAKADRCQKDLTNTQMWGQVDVSDSSCPLPNYDPWVRGDCTKIGIRTWYSRLQNIVGPWGDACANYAPVSFTADGTPISKPRADRCIDKAVLGMWGEVDVSDNSCPYFESWKKDSCPSFGVRQWSSRLMDIPAGMSWEDACNGKAVSFTTDNGVAVKRAKADRCKSTALAMWGEVDVPDNSCPYWQTWKRDGCSGFGTRQWSSRLWDIPASITWEDACNRKAVSFSVDGTTFSADKPHRCKSTGLEMWGEVDVPDDSCPYWGAPKKDSCTGPGLRQYSARLWDIVGLSYEEACNRKAVFITTDLGEFRRATPNRCKQWANEMWGEFDVPDGSCPAGIWGYFSDDGCSENGVRLYSASLDNFQGSWEEACMRMAVDVTTTSGTFQASSPTRCKTVNDKTIGEVEIPDSACVPSWLSSPMGDDGCVQPSIRQFSSLIDNPVPENAAQAIQSCMGLAVNFSPGPGRANITRTAPDRCTTDDKARATGYVDVRDSACTPGWSGFSDDGCVKSTVRQFSSGHDNPLMEEGAQAVARCLSTPVNFSPGGDMANITRTQPDKCKLTEYGASGVVEVTDASCVPSWGPFSDDGCVALSLRQFSASCDNPLPENASQALLTCSALPVNFRPRPGSPNITRSGPTYCNGTEYGIIGVVTTADISCQPSFSFGDDGCSRSGRRSFSSTFDNPVQEGPEQALQTCRGQPLTFSLGRGKPNVTRAAPDKCETTDYGIVAKVEVEDADCVARWDSSWADDGCVSRGVRRWSASCDNPLPEGTDPCCAMPVLFNASGTVVARAEPDDCEASAWGTTGVVRNPDPACEPSWTSWEDEGCVKIGTRRFASSIEDPLQEEEPAAKQMCATLPLNFSIPGSSSLTISRDAPDYCNLTDFGFFGYVEHADPTCIPAWEDPWSDDGCVSNGTRRFSSVLANPMQGGAAEAEAACLATPVDFAPAFDSNSSNITRARPDSCEADEAGVTGVVLVDDPSCQPAWSEWGEDGCVALNTRRYSASYDNPVQVGEAEMEQACMAMPVDFAPASDAGSPSITRAGPDSCETTDGGVTGVVQLPDSTCQPSWGEVQDDGCVAFNTRRFSALYDNPVQMGAEQALQACTTMPMSFEGPNGTAISRPKPDRCEAADYGLTGFVTMEDTACAAAWVGWLDAGCARINTRRFSSLVDDPIQDGAVQANQSTARCEALPVDFSPGPGSPNIVRAKPDQCNFTDEGATGIVDVADPACVPAWLEWAPSTSCARLGVREWSARLDNPLPQDWKVVWSTTAVSFTAAGGTRVVRPKPDSVRDAGSDGVFGEVAVQDASCLPKWSLPWQRNNCVRIGFRQYSAKLTNIVGDWRAACTAQPVSFTAAGAKVMRTKPDRCKNIASGPGGGTFGEVDVADPSCWPAWRSWAAGSCVRTRPGFRTWSARLTNIVGDWRAACNSTPLQFIAKGTRIARARPDRCLNVSGVVRGEVDARDSGCNQRKKGRVRP